MASPASALTGRAVSNIGASVSPPSLEYGDGVFVAGSRRKVSIFELQNFHKADVSDWLAWNWETHPLAKVQQGEELLEQKQQKLCKNAWLYEVGFQ
jgi:hypothetical protein